MPGIVGLVTRIGRERAEPQLRRMLEAITHEPFYTSGTWIDEASGVYVGWTAHQNSFAATMPLKTGRGDRVLVFSGEDYSGAGAAGVLSACESDRSFPGSLNGRFHGVVADVASGTVGVFN